MAAIEDGDREEVEDSEVDVEEDEELEGEAEVDADLDGEHGDDADWAAEVFDSDAGLLGVEEGREGVRHHVPDLLELGERGGTGFLDFVDGGAGEPDADASALGGLVVFGGDGEGETFLAAEDDGFAGLAGAFTDNLDELFLAEDGDAGEIEEAVIDLEPGAGGGHAGFDGGDDGVFLGVEAEHFKADEFVDRGGKVVGVAGAVSFDGNGDDIGAGDDNGGLDLVPGPDGFSVDGDDFVALADAEAGFFAGGRDVADDGGVDGDGEADQGDDDGDDEGEEDVHEGAGERDQDFGPGGDRGERVAVVFGAFENLRGEHLGEFDEPAGGDPAEGVFDVVPLPAHDLRSEADGEFEDLEAASAGDPVVAEFVDEDGGAEEEDDHDRHVGVHDDGLNDVPGTSQDIGEQMHDGAAEGRQWGGM